MQNTAVTIGLSHETTTTEMIPYEGIGLRLRARRLELNYTIQDIADLTKIQTAFIEALEEERFDTLPGQVYVVGFLKTYAKALGLPVCIVDDFFAHPHDKTPEVKQNYKMYLPRENKNFLNIAVVVIALLLFVVGGAVMYYTNALLNERDEIPLPIDSTSLQVPIESTVDATETALVDNDSEFLATDDDIDLHIADDMETVLQENEADEPFLEE